MKILVIGGMHGNERLGIDVVKLFQSSPIANIDTLLANDLAITANKRFVNKDLNRSFPGNLNSDSSFYEDKRAAEMLSITIKYDLVLDFHNTYCPDNDCGFIGEDASRLLDNVALKLGLRRIIVADYDCLNKYAANCLSVEISLSSKLNNAEHWYRKIIELSQINPVDLGTIDNLEELEKYRFVYRMTLEDKNKLSLAEYNLKAFHPIGSRLARFMGVKSPAYPIFIDDKFTPYNYGGLLNRID